MRQVYRVRSRCHGDGRSHPRGGSVSRGRPPPGDAGRSPKHVLLIDWDGVDPDFLGRVATPNLDTLVVRVSLTIGSSRFQTVLNPARGSMVTGAYPDTHENAAFHLDPASNTATGQERYLEAETIVEALAEEGHTVAAVGWYMVQDHGTGYGDPEHLYVQPGGTSATGSTSPSTSCTSGRSTPVGHG